MGSCVQDIGTSTIMLAGPLFLLFVLVPADAEQQKSRHPRLFLVSSSSTTSTISTTTLCYSTAATGFTTTACGRKKRAIYTDPVTGEEGGLDLDELINPQEPISDALEDQDEKYEDLVQSGEAEYEREGKFLLYWKTTTSTSTFSSYTATTTLGALECTPSSFGISQCPSNGKK